MFYKLIGMLVWNGGKLVLRRKLSRANTTRPLVAGGVLVAALGALLFVNARRDDS